ncbi:hypothetical protein [Planococcus maritimus]|uniref:hypothetical protein n=1 Tax=Planococcus maritimus TaxID=192421 RepID=UPI00232AB5AB|nr:hypothetical protein [Planococcus maritimus]
MIFPRQLIQEISEGIKFAEEETLTDYDLKNINQEDPITSRLATRIQDESNRIIQKSKYKGLWRCDVIELSNKGPKSLEKKHGFDMGITIKDDSRKFVKSLIIQNKMENSVTQNLEEQIENMSSLFPVSRGYVGLVDKAGIYITTGAEIIKHNYDLKELNSKDMTRLPDLVSDFLKCKVGQRNLDLQKLYAYRRSPKIQKKDIVVINFEKIKPQIE